ncbi:MAG: mandelate racemase/muconate lactonizing enzyme family protein [Bryobacterales bacterium]|nr:mandelate racemase/muconate lactonizing enzyme family protein [Bryobacterales bacterium]
MWTRRDMLRLAAALPAGGWLARYEALAAPYKGEVKITAVKALQLDIVGDGCLIRIDTDAGITGYGEAGVNARMARSRIENLPRLIGADPLAIERHFRAMTGVQHPFLPSIPTISGIDIALWDIAGKVTGLPVYRLLGGPFRPSVAMYSHGDYLKDMLDPASCREWAQMIRSAPEGFTTFKIEPTQCLRGERLAMPVTSAQLRKIARGFANVREAVGEEIDIGVHCHNQYDTPGAIGVAKATEAINPLFLEDALNVAWSEGWIALKRATRTPIMMGEKLELVGQFRPFLDNQAVDIVHPDISYAGGITGCRKIADYAALTRIPMALHNVGTLVRTYASAHLAASVDNFYRSESRLGRPGRVIEKMAAGAPPVVKNSSLQLPEGPGLGLEIDPGFIRQHMARGETDWA